ncbi:carbohydrate kinase [Clostridium frigoris]|uniref:Carbohydrate kinase n=1 Tax=Clostridium frigoris TaxID=205327 RepID=A0ABS6BQJ7_9CLOT|nr:carbohydrate kinase [Clostridium frigoris]MBU3159196.1 carbohydrate kinase [Clostridium frigoris]
MNKILCIGELLIDFICSDINSGLTKGENFVKKAGGAPANVSAAISKLGGQAYFAGKVGNDNFGIFLKETLEEAGVDTSMLILDKNSKTTLAFVSLNEDGEREFIFNRGADELLTLDELDGDKLKSFKIMHFGSATALLGGPSKETYLKSMELAFKNKVFISFDPNYRIDLWKNRVSDFVEISKQCLKYSDFVKVSDEEIKIISGKENIDEGVKFFHSLGAKVVAVTLGDAGTLISTNEGSSIINSIKIKCIDSTGAGDAFVGAFLYKLAQLSNPKSFMNNPDIIKDIILFSNKVGAVTCTKLGAIASLPTLEEVQMLK